jgi:hypothetical protein
MVEEGVDGAVPAGACAAAIPGARKRPKMASAVVALTFVLRV